VEQMIRVAAGEPLGLTQDDVGINGWAVESRVYAEDPYRNFMPSIGRLTHYRPPEEATVRGLTVRNDTGVVEGSDISMYYDPMIAKLITHGPDRESAIEHMAIALDAFTIDGIRHNIPFLSSLMDHPRWREGALTTNFIAEEYPEGFHGKTTNQELTETVVCIAAQIGAFLDWRGSHISGRMALEPDFSRDTVAVLLGRDRYDVAVYDNDGGELEVRFGTGDTAVTHRVVTDWHPGAMLWSGLIDGREINAQVRRRGERFHLSHRGVEVDVRLVAPHVADLVPLMPEFEESDMSKYLLCPMPGLLVSLAVTEGQEVQAGETLCVVEAMKMENVLRAEEDLVVAKINAKPGQSLAVDAVIMEFE
ncbi:MAG: acetyl/propionyl-CoA carboxylase subunit alpha, partial [Rhodobiaceae bacterium]|nr:acetyl/propionyl-CoA carboxylase subunit alpha [Rhodobiaceae bacterium]